MALIDPPPTTVQDFNHIWRTWFSALQTNVLSWVGGSATDNAVARFNGTTGQEIQNSGVIISDADAVTGVTALTVDNISIDGDTIDNTAANLNLDSTGGAVVIDGAATFTGGVITSVTSLDASGTVQGGTITDGAMSSTAGSVTGVTNLTVDNIFIDADTIDNSAGNLNLNSSGGNVVVDGVVTFNGGAITGVTSLATGTLSTTGTATLNDLTVGGGYGSTGVTISDTGNVQANGTLTVDGISTLAATSFSDANITNVGNIALDSITAAGSAITVTGNTTFADGAFDFDIASHDGTNGLKLAGTLVTSTAAELNIVDGGASDSGITIVDGDQIVINDSGTMVQTDVADLANYLQTAAVTHVTSTPYNVLSTDVILIVNPSAAEITINLLAGADEKIHYIKNIDSTNNVIVSANGAETIDGAATQTVTPAYGIHIVYSSSASGWFIIGSVGSDYVL